MPREEKRKYIAKKKLQENRLEKISSPHGVRLKEAELKSWPKVNMKKNGRSVTRNTANSAPVKKRSKISGKK